MSRPAEEMNAPPGKKNTLEDAIHEALAGDFEAPDPDEGQFDPAPDFDEERAAAPPPDADDDAPGDEVGFEDEAPAAAVAVADGDGEDPSLDLIDPVTGKTQRELRAEEEERRKGKSVEDLSDEELAEFPEDLKAHVKEETSKRFNELTKRLHNYRQEIHKSERESAAMRQALQSFNTTPENVSRLANFSRALTESSPQSLEYAWNEMVMFGQQLAQMLGRPWPVGQGYSPLDQHPDLKKAVDEFNMEEGEALRIAAERARGTLQNESVQRTQRQQAYQTAVSNVSSAVQNIETGLQSAVGENYDKPLFAGQNGAVSMKSLITDYAVSLAVEMREGRRNPQDIPGMVDAYARQLLSNLSRVIRPSTPPPPAARRAPPAIEDEPAPLRPGGRGEQGGTEANMYDAITKGLGMG